MGLHAHGCLAAPSPLQSGRDFDQALPLTFGYNSLCRLRAENPLTGPVRARADQAVSSVAGDRWRLVL